MSRRALRRPVLALAVFAALGGPVSTVSAASADDLLGAVNAAVPADELVAGNPARAEAIAALVATPGLPAAEQTKLRLALAEAWIDAFDAGRAEAELAPLLAAPGGDPALRERAGLAWVAAWQLRARAAGGEKDQQPADPLWAMKPFGALPPRVQARALAARARWKLERKDRSALDDLDAAIKLLADREPGERVPLYALRLTAMEESGAAPEVIRVWLQERRDDPAAVTAAEAALTAGQKLAGQPAPPLKAKRLDGQPGELDLTAYKGKPVLIDLFATWCKPCAITAPAVTAVARRWQPKGLVVLGVSLDTADTVPAIKTWIATHAIDWPIIGEGLGWDSELVAAWHVESIPRLILVDAEGVVVDADLGGATVEEVERTLEAAVAAQFADKPKVPAAGRVPGKSAPTVDDSVP